jgi:hypothetical protein
LLQKGETGTSQGTKAPAAPEVKRPTMMFSIHFGISLILLFSPVFTFELIHHASLPMYEINSVSLVPFIIGIALLILIKFKKF